MKQRKAIGSGASLRLAALLALLLSIGLLAPRGAAADLPTQLTQFGAWGTAGGQTQAVSSIGANQATGHLYLGEQDGARVSEFTAWGEFVRAWGWGVDDGASEFQKCTAASSCQAALKGSGPGQFQMANGISVAPNGDVYVFDRSNRRVQKFDSEGNFLLMFGGEVNKTTGEDVCTAGQVTGGDECGAGISGTGPSEFGIESVLGVTRNYISVAPDGTVYVGDLNRIQRFEPTGAFKEAIPLPEPGNPGALAVDPVSGDLYFAYSQGVNPSEGKENVFRLNGSGTVVDTLEAIVPLAIATDASGNVFVIDRRVFAGQQPEVLEFGPSGETLIGPGSKFTSLPSPDNEKFFENAIGTNVVTEAGGVDVYTAYTNGATVEFRRIFGPAPDKWPPPPNPPEINAQYATSVGSDAAVVKAEINPVFWADTGYHVEYGTAPCSGGGCVRVPSSGEIELGAGIVNANITTDGVELTGLSPGTQYHFRFIATSSGGAPTIGSEGTFTTFKPAVPRTDCPNQSFRTGVGALLPECRAYEMVSPVDKEGGEILGICNNSCFEARLDQAAPSGGAVTYSSYRSFEDPQAAPWASQYYASRSSSGWSSQNISPPQEGPAIIAGPALDVQFKGFLDDLSAGWFLTTTEPQLTPEAVPGFANLYHRSTSSGAYEALTTVGPPEILPENFLPELQGFSEDGSTIVFRANGKLTPDANSGTAFQLYEYSNGELHLVSVLPGNTAAASGSVGTEGTIDGRSSSVFQAVSDDGSVIYWSAGNVLYVRLSGVLTLPVSGSGAFFWGAAADGSRAIYTSAGKLFEFDLEKGESAEIAPSTTRVMGMSEDASRVYFVSQANLASGGIPGKENLYLAEQGGATKLVAILSAADISNSSGLSPVAERPFNRLARVSGDGMHAVFVSSASLTEFDNTDQASGEADSEVYLYDAAGSGDLHCISCNPSGARPSGQRLRIRNSPSSYWAAAIIPTWESQLYVSRVIAAGGDSVFFESFDPLSPRDVNGHADVYQWQREGTGECGEQSATFSEGAGGCVDLISDGVAESDSAFVDASADGGDVFFTTTASLVSQDPDLRDLYDARIGGGFAAPPSPPAECQGESCQGAGQVPVQSLPGSTSPGPGNPPQPKSRKCPKGKHRVKGKNGKRRCVKNRKHRKSQKSHHRGRRG